MHFHSLHKCNKAKKKMKKSLLFVVVFCLLITSALALTIEPSSLGVVELCGAESDVKVIDFGTISADENISLLEIELTIKNDVTLNGASLFQISFSNYISETEEDLGSLEVAGQCDVSQTSDITLRAYVNGSLELEEVIGSVQLRQMEINILLTFT